MDFQNRSRLATHPMAKKLFECMLRKKSNLALSADVTSCDELVELVERVGTEICLLKTHIDILSGFTPDFPKALMSLADEYDFLIFEDRQFADIGQTVKHPFQDDLYAVSSWADIVNAHLLTGPDIIEGLKAGRESEETGLLLLAQMSSKDNLLTDDYTQAAVRFAQNNTDSVMGFIAQGRLSDDPGFMTLTPGVKFTQNLVHCEQQYQTPECAVINRGADVIIVGRDIYAQTDPLVAARAYREAAWQAYLTRVWTC